MEFCSQLPFQNLNEEAWGFDFWYHSCGFTFGRIVDPYEVCWSYIKTSLPKGFHFLYWFFTYVLPSHFWCGFTLGPIPDGADAVVQVEDTEKIEGSSLESKRIRILVKTSKGTDIRPVVCNGWFLEIFWQNCKIIWCSWFWLYTVFSNIV